MSEVTLAELERRLESVERRFNDTVYKEVYQRDMKEIRLDISEIKDSQKWAQRLIAGQFVTLVLGLLVYLVTQWPAN